MTQSYLKKLQYLINCNPYQCVSAECPNYSIEENKCLYENVLNSFNAIINEKFKERNKEE